MKGRVMHNLPGRLRLAAEGLKYLKDESGEIAGELAHISGVRRARVTPVTGGLLLEYDESVLDALELAEEPEMHISRESKALRFFSREEIGDIQIAITHKDIVEDWFCKGENARVCE